MEDRGSTRPSRGASVSLLADIVASKRREVEVLRSQARSPSQREPIDVVRALRRGTSGLRIIAEVKLRSSSAGALSRALAPDDRALVYGEAGAAMVSVLCDAHYFDGSWEHLAAARSRFDVAGGALTGVPLLAKDFVVDPRQIQQARDRGADAILLIARIVSGPALAELVKVARAEGVEPFVEVVDEPELERALAARARLIGVNARDLDTLRIDVDVAARVLASIPPEVVAVHLSGLRATADVAVVARGRADAALIGEVLMRQDDPRPLLRAMVEASGAR
jgi:indole-3-glycerol phosphate synthase